VLSIAVASARTRSNASSASGAVAAASHRTVASMGSYIRLLLAPNRSVRLLQARRDPLQEASVEGRVAQEWPKKRKREVP
jgi:hypothetical protein